jgi:hypothetical protein
MKESAKTDMHRLRYLRVAFVLAGLISIAGLYPLMVLWPSGWAWSMEYSDYPMMIVGIYATLGVFLIIAARNPLEHLSLIWFGDLVERRARRNHGRSVFRACRASWAPAG